MRPSLGLAAVGVLLLLPAAPAVAQEGGGEAAIEPEVTPLAVSRDHGFAASWIGALDAWGWHVSALGDSARARGPNGTEITVLAGTPFVRRGGSTIQLADAPYVEDAALFVPIQLFRELALEIDVLGGSLAPSRAVPVASSSDGEEDSTPIPEDAADASSLARVVVIDAGHGGRDLGALGYGGTREKDVVLAVALALEKALEAWPEYEVHLLRDGDEFVPLWERGGLATEAKGDAPGVFLSIHANSHPTSREAQGFETFFLAEARTDHERRISALENAPLTSSDRPGPVTSAEDLAMILGELRNADYQRWSAHLATLVQDELANVHPGRDRGVSQAPLAAITTSLMPSVLIELGFVTNADEETLLNQADFQTDVAEAMARAVDGFFQGYPPRSPSAQAGRQP
jgi:N-acetylmuramoyl-L-alanine amidase